MNNSYYIYSLLKYKHSALLGERLNIGLLVYFPIKNKFIFKHSKTLRRVKNIYNNVSEKTIKHYLKQIDYKVESFNNKPNIFNQLEIKDNLEFFINKELLPSDSSVLQFDNSIKNIQYEESDSFVVESLINSYFKEIKNISDTSVRKEPYLSKKFYTSLGKLNFDKINKEEVRFYENYKVVNDTGTIYKFDYGWKNGKLNLVKPLSFDLKTARSIEDKAHQNLGKFIDLENEAEKDNLHYDLLVARPKNKDFFKEYDHALKLLETPKYLSIVEENNIIAYSLKAIKALTLF